MSPKLKEFLRAQLSAFVGGLSDLTIYSFCYKILLISAPFANAISGSLGAIINFVVNRYWAFSNTRTPITTQLWRFVLVVIGSIILKSLGIYVLVDLLKIHYLISKLAVELVVSLGFNFVLQKYWVFRKC